MFIVYPTNIDYLIEDVRLRIGDTSASSFSDSIVRSAILSAVKSLQRRWSSRYLVYTSDFIIPSDGVDVPSGYIYVGLPQGSALIASGYEDNDVFRNPYHTFVDTSTAPISQEDEPPIIISAAIILRRSSLSSSASAFVNWSDGEYSYSNVSSANAQQTLLKSDLDELELYFRRRLALPVRDSFAEIYIG